MPIKSLTSHAFALPRFALPSPGPAPQSNAFAARINPSPLHAAALLRHCPVSRCSALRCRRCSQPVLAELPNASAHRSVAGPSRVRAFPCYSFAAPSIAALILRRSSPSCACPSPSEAQPCISIASPSKSKRFLRRFSQRISFAALGLAGLLRRRAARRCAFPFRRLPEQIKALPLQRPSSQRHRDARPSHANPVPPTSSRCRRIALKAALRCSVAPPRYAAQIHRRTMHLCALPPRIIATLR